MVKQNINVSVHVIGKSKTFNGIMILIDSELGESISNDCFFETLGRELDKDYHKDMNEGDDVE